MTGFLASVVKDSRGGPSFRARGVSSRYGLPAATIPAIPGVEGSVDSVQPGPATEPWHAAEPRAQRGHTAFADGEYTGDLVSRAAESPSGPRATGLPNQPGISNSVSMGESSDSPATGSPAAFQSTGAGQSRAGPADASATVRATPASTLDGMQTEDAAYLGNSTEPVPGATTDQPATAQTAQDAQGTRNSRGESRTGLQNPDVSPSTRQSTTRTSATRGAERVAAAPLDAVAQDQPAVRQDQAKSQPLQPAGGQQQLYPAQPFEGPDGAGQTSAANSAGTQGPGIPRPPLVVTQRATAAGESSRAEPASIRIGQVNVVVEGPAQPARARTAKPSDPASRLLLREF